MNLDGTQALREPLQALLDSGSRINANKTERYWYPLSVATYDVEEVLAAVDSLCSFRTTMWQKTAAFEARFAELHQSPEAVMVNSGSSADLLIAFAMVNPQVKLLAPGDEVLVPAVTWPTQVWSPMMAGLSVRFVDVDPATCNADLDALEAAVGPRTRAISLVHLMGNPCDMDRVLAICAAHDLVLLEDCCESLGARFQGKAVGTFGLASAFSFFFSHHITTMEGGMIVTQDEELSDVFRLLRAHGWARSTKYLDVEETPGVDPRYTFLNWGFNVRPTELQAAFGLVQLERLAGFHEQRVANADAFRRLIEPVSDVLHLMEVHEAAECSWFALPFVVDPEATFTRNELVAHLEAQGVETRPIVAGNLARHPVVERFPEIKAADLPGADVIHDRGFYLGLHPVAEGPELERLASLIVDFVAGRS